MSLQIHLQHRFPTGFTLELAIDSPARTVALYGPSGSGKSSILSAVAGLLTPQQGRIVVDGHVLLDRALGINVPAQDRRTGYVVQDALLFPLLTVRQNLLFGQPRGARTLSLEQVVALLEIGHLLDRRPRNLSGGERQRVALGRAVLSEPRVALLDEPFSALDTARRQRLVAAVARLRDALDLPMILVSHQRDEITALADEVIHIDEGRRVPADRP